MAILEGMCEWAAVKVPNTTFTPEYQITLVLDDKTADDFISRGFRVKDVEGVKKIMFKRKVERKDGTLNAVPKLLNASKEPLDISVGNGSKVRVQYREWETTNQYGDFKGLDLQAVQVLDLIEYTGSDGSELESIDDDDLEF
jgi:hypothetical protein